MFRPTNSRKTAWAAKAGSPVIPASRSNEKRANFSVAWVFWGDEMLPFFFIRESYWISPRRLDPNTFGLYEFRVVKSSSSIAFLKEPTFLKSLKRSQQKFFAHKLPPNFGKMTSSNHLARWNKFFSTLKRSPWKGVPISLPQFDQKHYNVQRYKKKYIYIYNPEKKVHPKHSSGKTLQPMLKHGNTMPIRGNSIQEKIS